MLTLTYNQTEKKTEGAESFFADNEIELFIDGKPKSEKPLNELFLNVGFDDAISELNGSFAIVLFDKRSGRLYMGRDRLGSRQLYYTIVGDSLMVSTYFEPCFRAAGCIIDKASLQHYFSFQYVPEPLTIGKGVFAVHSGYYVIFDGKIEAVKYNIWKPEPAIKADRAAFRREVRKTLKAAVNEAISGAERPAAFLSGGLDSSILAAIAAKTRKDLTVYTVSFDVPGFSEADVAARSAEFYGVKQKVIPITADDFAKAVPFAVKAMGVPVADPSAVAVSLMAEAVSGKTDCILSGEGSDELWGGYHVYNPRGKVLKIKALPTYVKKIIWFFAKNMKDDARGKDFLRRGCVPLKDRYLGNTFLFTDKEKKSLLKSFDPSVKFTDITASYFRQAASLSEMDQMQFIDTNLWLPGDINIVSGKGCSERGINVEMPFMDNSVTDLARTLTKSEKVDGEQNKVILREAFKDMITDEVRNGKKKGYPTPVRVWLSGALNDWARECIKKADVDEYINKNVAYELLDKCKEEPQNLMYYRKAWAIVIFCIWRDYYA